MSEVDVDDYDASVLVGITFDAAPPGSKQFACEDCGHEITLGPNQQKVMAENPLHTFIKLCMRCVIKRQIEDNEFEASNVHQAKDGLKP